MGTITWIGILIIVAISAFFIGAFVTKKQFKQDELEQQVEQANNALEQYRQDVADHLASTGKLVSKMKDNYDQLLNHVEETNKLLLADKNSIQMSRSFLKKRLSNYKTHYKTAEAIVQVPKLSLLTML